MRIVIFKDGSQFTIFNEEGAFRDCTSLQSITLPDGVTSISKSTFFGCSSLTSIDFPESVTNIDFLAFYNCSDLASITFNGTTAQWNAITKGSNWNYKVPATHVHCTDGDVAL